jgi:hypothetical protein
MAHDSSFFRRHTLKRANVDLGISATDLDIAGNNRRFDADSMGSKINPSLCPPLALNCRRLLEGVWLLFPTLSAPSCRGNKCLISPQSIFESTPRAAQPRVGPLWPPQIKARKGLHCNYLGITVQTHPLDCFRQRNDQPPFV